MKSRQRESEIRGLVEEELGREQKQLDMPRLRALVPAGDELLQVLLEYLDEYNEKVRDKQRVPLAQQNTMRQLYRTLSYTLLSGTYRAKSQLIVAWLNKQLGCNRMDVFESFLKNIQRNTRPPDVSLELQAYRSARTGRSPTSERFKRRQVGEVVEKIDWTDFAAAPFASLKLQPVPSPVITDEGTHRLAGRESLDCRTQKMPRTECSPQGRRKVEHMEQHNFAIVSTLMSLPPVKPLRKRVKR